MTTVTTGQVEDMSTTVQRAHQIALVVEETTLQMTRGPDENWCLELANGERLSTFVELLLVETSAAWRLVQEMAGVSENCAGG